MGQSKRKMITYEHLNDKIKAFILAGEDTSGYDYAIPQAIYEELIRMGVENPGEWYCMDCRSNPWRLRHVGEAVYLILAARKKANDEIMGQLVNGDHNEWVNDIFSNFPDNQVFHEADCGLLDMKMVISIVNESFKAGQFKAQTHILESAIKPGDDTTKPYRIVLHRSQTGAFVTHMQTTDNGAYGGGHYFPDKNEAMRDYIERCKSYHLDPYV